MMSINCGFIKTLKRLFTVNSPVLSDCTAFAVLLILKTCEKFSFLKCPAKIYLSRVHLCSSNLCYTNTGSTTEKLV